MRDYRDRAPEFGPWVILIFRGLAESGKCRPQMRKEEREMVTSLAVLCKQRNQENKVFQRGGVGQEQQCLLL